MVNAELTWSANWNGAFYNALLISWTVELLARIDAFAELASAQRLDASMSASFFASAQARTSLSA